MDRVVGVVDNVIVDDIVFVIVYVNVDVNEGITIVDTNAFAIGDVATGVFS